MAQILNNNIQLDILYVKENQYIAVSDFFAYSYDDYYNGEDWDISMRMKFEDGSSMDDSFFNTGFEDLVDEATGFSEELDTSYETND
jgi:hypothetical protein